MIPDLNINLLASIYHLSQALQHSSNHISLPQTLTQEAMDA
jgi:hypothetical protein